ncbi:hypothetical protein N752_26460 [Desulforamulus aquiferis]|nr:hypothetical protein N752_26460 [Desulforamulus aquiferis]
MQTGQVKMSAITSVGMEKVIWYLNAPNVFGEVPFFHKQPSRHIISAAEDTVVYSFSLDFFLKHISDYPDIMLFLYKLLAQKVRVITNQIEDLCTSNPGVRLAKLLYLMAHQNGKKLADNKYLIDIKLTHQELANISGLHRVTTSNILKKLSEEKL